MKNIHYKLIISLLFLGILFSNAQKFEQDFSKIITVKKGVDVTLVANYADIEIIEWNKNKIKVDAVITVEGVDEHEAKKYLEFWKIDVRQNNNEVKIISQSLSTKNERYYLNGDSGFEPPYPPMPPMPAISPMPPMPPMPEISIESLGILDSINFSFPEINFNEIFNDSTFIKIYTYDFKMIDSLNTSLDFEKLKKNQKYLQEWQEANAANFIKLREKALALAKRNKEVHEKRTEMHQKRLEKHHEKMEKMNQKRLEHSTKVKEKRQELRAKVSDRRNKIKKILKNRNEVKVRTKLIIRVPKGTDFNMNVNYSKISTN